MFMRLYTGDDGQSHLEELDMESGPTSWTEMQKATGITFRSTEPQGKDSVQWHTAPRRQYCITLSGEAEIGLGDGTFHRFGAGDVMLAEDLTGQGHTTRSVGEGPRVVAYVPVE